MRSTKIREKSYKQKSYCPSYTEQSSRELSKSKKKSKSIHYLSKLGHSKKYMLTAESEVAPKHLRIRSLIGAIPSPSNDLNITPPGSSPFNKKKSKNHYTQYSDSKHQSTVEKKKLKRSYSKSKGSLSKSRSKSRRNL